jgi:hypothetical protein
MEIGCDLRNVRVYAGLALAAELSVAMDKPRRAAISLFFLWRTYRRLGSLNRGLEELIEAYEQNCSSAPVASVEQYRFERDLLLGLHAFCARILSPQEGLPKLGLMSKKLARLQINAERLLDLADWLDALSTPEEMNAKFDAALADLERGDVVSWAAVQ